MKEEYYLDWASIRALVELTKWDQKVPTNRPINFPNSYIRVGRRATTRRATK